MLIEALLVAISLILFLIPVLVPKGKWFWIGSAIIALPLIYVWAEHFYYTWQPDYDYGNPAASVLGVFIGMIITGSFLLGLLVRFSIWLIKQLGGGKGRRVSSAVPEENQ